MKLSLCFFVGVSLQNKLQIKQLSVLISEKQPTNSFEQLTVYICATLMGTCLKMLAVVSAAKRQNFLICERKRKKKSCGVWIVLQGDRMFYVTACIKSMLWVTRPSGSPLRLLSLLLLFTLKQTHNLYKWRKSIFHCLPRSHFTKYFYLLLKTRLC